MSRQRPQPKRLSTVSLRRSFHHGRNKFHKAVYSRIPSPGPWPLRLFPVAPLFLLRPLSPLCPGCVLFNQPIRCKPEASIIKSFQSQYCEDPRQNPSCLSTSYSEELLDWFPQVVNLGQLSLAQIQTQLSSSTLGSHIHELELFHTKIETLWGPAATGWQYVGF